MKTLIIANRAFGTLVASYVRQFHPTGDIFEASSSEKANYFLITETIDIKIVDIGVCSKDFDEKAEGKVIRVDLKRDISSNFRKFLDKLKKVYA